MIALIILGIFYAIVAISLYFGAVIQAPYLWLKAIWTCSLWPYYFLFNGIRDELW